MAADKYTIMRFDSVASFIEKMNGTPIAKGAGESSVTGTKSFTGTKSYEEACELALYGDKESAAKIEQSATRLRIGNVGSEDRAQSRVRREVVGSRPCVPAAIVGHPCSMYRRHTVHVKRPVVNVFYSMSATCGIGTDDLANVGAKFVEAVRIVERSGVRVNLYAGELGQCRNEKMITVVRIKDSNKDMDVLRMAYPLANPSFLRRHIFRRTEIDDTITQEWWCDGYGRPMQEKEDEEKAMAELAKHGTKIDCCVSFYNARTCSAREMAERMMGQR